MGGDWVQISAPDTTYKDVFNIDWGVKVLCDWKVQILMKKNMGMAHFKNTFAFFSYTNDVGRRQCDQMALIFV